MSKLYDSCLKYFSEEHFDNFTFAVRNSYYDKTGIKEFRERFVDALSSYNEFWKVNIPLPDNKNKYVGLSAHIFFYWKMQHHPKIKFMDWWEDANSPEFEDKIHALQQVNCKLEVDDLEFRIGAQAIIEASWLYAIPKGDMCLLYEFHACNNNIATGYIICLYLLDCISYLSLGLESEALYTLIRTTIQQTDRQLLLHKLERLNYFKDIEIFPLELYLLLSEGVIVGEEE